MRCSVTLAIGILAWSTAAFAADSALSSYAECDPGTRALVDKVVAGFGGESAIATIETIRGVAQITQKVQGGDYRMSIDALSSFPDRLHARIRTSQGTMTIAITAQDAYIIPARAAVKGAAIRLTPEERDDLLHFFACDPLFILRNRRDPHYFFASGSVEKVDGIDCRKLMVFADGFRIDWLVDPTTGRVVRTDVGGQVSEFSNWTSVGKIPVPRVVRTTQNGKLVSEMSYVEYEINPNIDVTPIFRRPDLWLMRWTVQPGAGQSRAGAGDAGDSRAYAQSGKTAATYRPPEVDGGANVTIWDPAAGSDEFVPD